MPDTVLETSMDFIEIKTKSQRDAIIYLKTASLVSLFQAVGGEVGETT